MKDHNINQDRRGLLKTLAMAPVAGAAVAATPALAESKPVEAKTEGYRETDHVRRYYATLRGE